MNPKQPLVDHLKDSKFEIPFSFIYGDIDWVLNVDEGVSRQLIEAKKE